MKKFICLFLTFFFQYSFAQGIHFEQGLTWDQVLEKAKQENKLIFADCYTTWCGPCKRMDKETFSDASVGAFFNENFINIKVQMDKTRSDSEFIKTWHETANRWEKSYAIHSYPTYMVFDQNGNAVNRSGSYQAVNQLLKTGKDLIDVKNGYYAQLRVFEGGGRDSLLLHDLLGKSEKFNQNHTYILVLETYLENQQDWMNPKNLDLMLKAHPPFQSKIYQFLADQKATLMQNRKYTTKIQSVLYEAAYNAIVEPLISSGPNWNMIEDSLIKYVTEDAGIYLFKAKVSYLSDQIDLKKMRDLVSEVGAVGKPEYKYFAIREFSWALAEKSDNMEELQQAWDWSNELLVFSKPKKAKIAYKLGNTAEAIALMQEEIKQVFLPEFVKLEYQRMVEKMKNGEELVD